MWEVWFEIKTLGVIMAKSWTMAQGMYLFYNWLRMCYYNKLPNIIFCITALLHG